MKLNYLPFLLAFCAGLAHIPCQAQSLCPADHLEPALDWGHAFGAPELATTSADLGKLDDFEDVVFEYFEYQSHLDTDKSYARIYAIHLVRNQSTGKGRLFLVRLRNKLPETVEVDIDAPIVTKVLALAGPVARDTHYQQADCDIAYLDGSVLQLASGSISNPTLLKGGEAYIPIKDSPAGQMMQLGRALRKVALKEMTSAEFLQQFAAARTNSGPPAGTGNPAGVDGTYGEMLGVIEGVLFAQLDQPQKNFCIEGTRDDQVKSIADTLRKASEHNDQVTLSDVPTRKEANAFLMHYFPCVKIK